MKNIPAAYLTGFLAGKKAVKAGTTSAIVDLGLVQPIPKSRIFSAIKGAIDAGLSIPCSEKMFPSEKRLRGEHIADYAKDLSKNQPSAFERQFGKISKGRVDLTTLPTMYDKAKSDISTKNTRGRSTQ
jgi:large subunit ribosomal protein L18